MSAAGLISKLKHFIPSLLLSSTFTPKVIMNFIMNYFCFVPGAGHASVGGLSITKRKNVKVIRNMDTFF
jgi:hypothetical protein